MSRHYKARARAWEIYGLELTDVGAETLVARIQNSDFTAYHRASEANSLYRMNVQGVSDVVVVYSRKTKSLVTFLGRIDDLAKHAHQFRSKTVNKQIRYCEEQISVMQRRIVIHQEQIMIEEKRIAKQAEQIRNFEDTLDNLG